MVLNYQNYQKNAVEGYSKPKTHLAPELGLEGLPLFLHGLVHALAPPWVGRGLALGGPGLGLVPAARVRAAPPLQNAPSDDKHVQS